MSLIYAANSKPQVGRKVNFGSAVRHNGCKCGIANGNVFVKEKGFYDVNINITFMASAHGNVSITLYKDGIAIPGATQTATTYAGSIIPFSVPAIIRQDFTQESSITAEVEGEGSVTNAAIMVADYE